MARHSNRTLDEIAQFPEGDPDENEQDDPSLETVSPEGNSEPFKITANTVPAAAFMAPGIEEARDAAQIPPQLSVSELIDRPIVIIDKRSQRAYNVNKSEWSSGYQCLCAFMDTKKPFTVWIGQSALMRDLEAFSLPLRVTIAKVGARYRFH